MHVYTLPLKRDELTKQTEAFRKQLAARDLGFRPAAFKLYESLLKPAEDQLRGRTNLIIVPDNTLWDLPFQTLVNSDNRFMIEDAAISYAPSLTVLREMTKSRKFEAAHASPPSARSKPRDAETREWWRGRTAPSGAGARDTFAAIHTTRCDRANA